MTTRQGKSGPAEAREARLKAALKSNIARRKAQAKARDSQSDKGQPSERKE